MVHIFLINPFAGDNMTASAVRKQLSEFKNLDYFVFNIQRAGYETELVHEIEELFDDKLIRLYCCGGSGTLRNIIAGITDFNRMEVAFYPCGTSNDFLQSFGSDAVHFRDIKKLINGYPCQIDYIKTDYGPALSAVSLGLSSRFQKYLGYYRFTNRLYKRIPRVLAQLHSALLMKPLKLHIQCDDSEVEDSFSELVFANGCFAGELGEFAEPNTDNLTDGKASLFSLKKVHPHLALYLMHLHKKKNIARIMHYSSVQDIRELSIRSTNEVPLVLCIDGELISDVRSCRIELVNRGLKFIVPKEVRLS